MRRIRHGHESGGSCHGETGIRFDRQHLPVEVSWRIPRLFRRRHGRAPETRAWPWLVLFAGAVVVGIGCVFWFMREAMRNERMAERQRLADAYRGHVALLQTYLEDASKKIAADLNGDELPALRFFECVRSGRASSVIIRNASGAILYPIDTFAVEASATAQELQSDVRALVTAGREPEAIDRIVQTTGAPAWDKAFDSQGRLVAANLELLGLQLMKGAELPQFDTLAQRLRQRANDYAGVRMPSSQRRFVMRELRRLVPAAALLPTFEAEDYAAHYLEAGTAPSADGFQATALPGLWQRRSADGTAIGLFTTDDLRKRFHAVIDKAPPLRGARVHLFAPGDEPRPQPAALIALPAGTFAPGWTLLLSLDDVQAFETAADRKVTRYLWIGIVVAGVMTVLAAGALRAFGRQVILARLKNDLVASVSHELKTPLTSMRVLVDSLLESSDFSPKETREYLELLATENARLSRLIDNFLTFSRMERNKFRFAMSAVAPQQIIAQAATAFGERLHDPRCQFEARCAPDLKPILADADAMTIALVNLLENAWKYSGDEKRIVLRAEQRNGAVTFAVDDNGVGLSPRESRRIFGRFYQVDQRLSREVGGCGLGLSIVDYIVRNHRGRVRVESKLGAGSTFIVEVPVA
jgi:signal transduction histidine kinase